LEAGSEEEPRREGEVGTEVGQGVEV